MIFCLELDNFLEGFFEKGKLLKIGIIFFFSNKNVIFETEFFLFFFQFFLGIELLKKAHPIPIFQPQQCDSDPGSYRVHFERKANSDSAGDGIGEGKEEAQQVITMPNLSTFE